MLGCATVNVGIQEDSSGQICIWIHSKLSGRERDLTCEFANRDGVSWISKLVSTTIQRYRLGVKIKICLS